VHGGPTVIVDAGPIVAWLTRSDAHHAWVKAQFERLRPPLLTCEAALTEAASLVEYAGGDPSKVPALSARGVFRLAPVLAEHGAHVTQLMRRYSNVPMSLADACLVRLSEMVPDALVFTLDTDFFIYRRRGRAVIPLLTPAGRWAAALPGRL
jgi:predicted nucleic acid-binding protein